MILVHILDLTAYLSHPLMQPDEDGNPSRMQLAIDGKRTKAVYSDDGNEVLVILADIAGIPMDDYPDIADAYTLEQVFGYTTPNVYEDGTKVLDDDGEVQMIEVQHDPAVRAIYDRIYPRTPYIVTPTEGEPYEVTPPLIFGVIAGHKTSHLLTT